MMAAKKKVKKTSKKKATRKLKRLWLARANQYYNINMGSKPTKDSHGCWPVRSSTLHACASHVHYVLPKSLHLPPGGGPVEFRIVAVDKK